MKMTDTVKPFIPKAIETDNVVQIDRERLDNDLTNVMGNISDAKDAAQALYIALMRIGRDTPNLDKDEIKTYAEQNYGETLARLYNMEIPTQIEIAKLEGNL